MCAACAHAAARFAVSAADATVREIWRVAAPERQPISAARAPEPWEERILADVQRDLDAAAVLDAFRASVSELVPESDAATHAELGIAYRELGLHDDAHREFKVAARAAPDSRRVELDVLSVLSLVESGRHFEAIRASSSFIVSHPVPSAQVVAVLFALLPASAVSDLRERLFPD